MIADSPDSSLEGEGVSWSCFASSSLGLHTDWAQVPSAPPPDQGCTAVAPSPAPSHTAGLLAFGTLRTHHCAHIAAAGTLAAAVAWDVTTDVDDAAVAGSYASGAVAAGSVAAECAADAFVAAGVDTAIVAKGAAGSEAVGMEAAEAIGVVFAVAAAVHKADDVVAEAAGAAHDEGVVFEPETDSPACSVGSRVGTSGSLVPRLQCLCPSCTDLAAQPC